MEPSALSFSGQSNAFPYRGEALLHANLPYQGVATLHLNEEKESVPRKQTVNQKQGEAK